MPSFSLSLFIDQEYISVYAYAGIEAIKSRLLEEGAIVVLTEDDAFMGVLTPADVLVRAHNLVIDCLREKPIIRPDQSINEVLDVMLDNQELVLPVVYEHGKLAGLLHQSTLVHYLMKENRRLAEEKKNLFR